MEILLLMFLFGGNIESKRRQGAQSRDDNGSTALLPGPVAPVKALKEPLQSYKKGDRHFYFAGDDGLMQLVDAEDQADTDFIASYLKDPNYNTYMLFTKSNRYTPQFLVHGDSQSVSHSNFDSAKVTVFLAHGWKGFGKNNMNQVLSNAFLADGDVNVVVFDWSKLAKKTYITAKSGTAAVGRLLGSFIKWMVDNGFAVYHKIHLVGFSLGGHLVGNAGRETGGAVGRITALDPAGPAWYGDKERLVSTDAQYVEVIHTNTHLYGKVEGEGLGYLNACGDADFYPNGGKLMDGCLLNACSHSRAYEYMANTLLYNNFKGNECGDYNDAVNDKCTGPANLMGNSDLYKPQRGIFRVNTKKNFPYM